MCSGRPPGHPFLDSRTHSSLPGPSAGPIVIHTSRPGSQKVPWSPPLWLALRTPTKGPRPFGFSIFPVLATCFGYLFLRLALAALAAPATLLPCLPAPLPPTWDPGRPTLGRSTVAESASAIGYTSVCIDIHKHLRIHTQICIDIHIHLRKHT